MALKKELLARRQQIKELVDQQGHLPIGVSRRLRSARDAVFSRTFLRRSERK